MVFVHIFFCISAYFMIQTSMAHSQKVVVCNNVANILYKVWYIWQEQSFFHKTNKYVVMIIEFATLIL